MSEIDGQWWEKSWNPVKLKGISGYHCTKISPGCLNCWSEVLNMRFGNKIPYDNRPVEYEIDQKVLEKPLHWKKPCKIFVGDMLDLFHEQIPFEFIEKVFDMIDSVRQHTYLILTKRPARVIEFFKNSPHTYYIGEGICTGKECPIGHVWLGVSVENQKTTDERIPLLLQIPATHRFINFEPLLSDIDLVVDVKFPYAKEKIDWVIIGCESLGSRTGRPCELEWVKSIVQQCRTAGVPVFIKQLNIKGKLVKNLTKFPIDLQLREWPK